MLQQMEEGGVQTSIISISDPGVHFGDNAAARALARECNEFAAKVVRDNPTRFGFFAVLPLPDVDGALREAAYALDTLKADGIGVLSSYEGQVPRQPGVRAADGRAQPPQGRRLLPSVLRRLRRADHADRRAEPRRRVRVRHDAHDPQPAADRDGRALPRHQFHLVARRRDGAVHHEPPAGRRAEAAQRA